MMTAMLIVGVVVRIAPLWKAWKGAAELGLLGRGAGALPWEGVSTMGTVKVERRMFREFLVS